MRGLLKVFVWTAIGLAGVVVAGSLSLQFIEPTRLACEETEHLSIPSPNGSLEAIVHERNCGATTPFNTQVSVVERLRIAETSRDPLFVVHGRYDVPARWIDDTTLTIGIPAGEQVYRKDTTFDGGRIVYEDGRMVPPRTQAKQ